MELKAITDSTGVFTPVAVTDTVATEAPAISRAERKRKMGNAKEKNNEKKKENDGSKTE